MKLLFIDFDETLFSHQAYLAWFDAFLEHYGAKKGAFSERIKEFHEPIAQNLNRYDHAAHMEAIVDHGWPFMAGEIDRALAKEKYDFCYPDVHAFLREVVKQGYHPCILTYGSGEYQRYKINTCSALRKLRLPAYVVNESKAAFLTREFPDKPGILIDDKHPLDLPPNWQHVWLQRGRTGAISRAKDGALEMQSLRQFGEAVRVLETV